MNRKSGCCVETLGGAIPRQTPLCREPSQPRYRHHCLSTVVRDKTSHHRPTSNRRLEAKEQPAPGQQAIESPPPNDTRSHEHHLGGLYLLHHETQTHASWSLARSRGPRFCSSSPPPPPPPSVKARPPLIHPLSSKTSTRSSSSRSSSSSGPWNCAGRKMGAGDRW